MLEKLHVALKRTVKTREAASASDYAERLEAVRLEEEKTRAAEAQARAAQAQARAADARKAAAMAMLAQASAMLAENDDAVEA